MGEVKSKKRGEVRGKKRVCESSLNCGRIPREGRGNLKVFATRSVLR